MAEYKNFKEIQHRRKEISKQRQFLGEEIQKSFTDLGSGPTQPWYKDMGNWFFVGDVAMELFKRFKK
jgi:hypothetical protein